MSSSSITRCSSYIALGALTLIGLIENYGRILFSVSIIPFIDTTSYEYSLLNGIIFSFFYGFAGLIMILLSEVYFKYSENYFKIETYLLSFASFIFSVSLGLTATVSTFTQLALLRILLGITQSALVPFATSIISYYFDSYNRGFALAVFQLGTYIAYSSSLSLGTFVYDVYGWKTGYIAVGVLGILFSCILFIVLTLFPPTPTLPINTQLVTSPHVPSDNSSSSSTRQDRNRKGEVVVKYKQLEYSQSSMSSSKQTLPVTMTINRKGVFEAVPRTDRDDDDDDDDLEEVQLNNPSSPKDKVSDSLLLLKQVENSNNNNNSVGTTSFLRRIYDTLTELITVWNSNPILYLLAVATGIRLAAGYVWSSYTTIFFSELWIRQSVGGTNNQFQACSYSYNSSVPDSVSQSSDPMTAATDICGPDFPYCAFYNNYNTELGSQSASSSSYFCSYLNPTPWHNIGLTHQEIEKYLSWMPLVGSGFGSICGGILSDKLAERFARVSVRPLLIALGNLIAVPIVAYAFLSSYPTCFLVQIASGFVGELYFSQSSVLVILLTPTHLVACSIALFSLIINTIAGISLLLVPFIYRIYRSQFDSFTADFIVASYYSNSYNTNTNTMDVQTMEVSLSLSGGGGDSLQAALIAIQVSLYLTAGVLYLVCFGYYYRKYD